MAQGFIQIGSTEANVTAAQYRPGQPLNELIEVARLRRLYGRAEAVEVPEWRCLLVRMMDEDGDKVDYLVVEDGGWLAYESAGLHLHTHSGKEFALMFRPEQGG
jgi:hypothetical protein